MIRTASMAALALAFLSSAALAQSRDPSNGPPSQLSGTPDYDDRDAPPPDVQAQNAQPQDSARDLNCRRSAAARTGYYSPDQAARDERTSSSIGGALAGAALGAVIGAASHNAGPGALIGAGAGLIAGTAIGEGNGRRAAADVQAAYADEYYACMADRDGPQRDARYAYGPPPPPAYYAPYPAPYPYYYGPSYYGPSVRLNFGFGGGWGRGGFHGRGHR